MDDAAFPSLSAPSLLRLLELTDRKSRFTGILEAGLVTAGLNADLGNGILLDVVGIMDEFVICST